MSKVKPHQLRGGDVVLYKTWHGKWFNKCCGCELWHEIVITPREQDLRIEFIRLAGPPDLEECEAQNIIEREVAM